MHTPYTIGITGGSGSGKSFLVKSLAQKFDSTEVAFLSQDNYYKLREDQQEDENGVRNFDLPESFLMDDFHRDLELLLKGETVTRQEYNYNNPEAEPVKIQIAPATVLIVEGLFILCLDKISALLDLKVFVDANDVMKLKRRILRDRVERNYPLEDVLYRYEHHVLPSYNKYIEPYKEAADVIINNNQSMERGTELVSGFIRGMIG